MAKRDKHLYPSVHRGIVRAALLLLALEQHPAAQYFSASHAETLIAEAAVPDKIGDRHQGRGLHYYCSVHPDGSAHALHPVLCGFCNAKGAPAPSPLTVLDAEYRAALSLCRAGKTTSAMQSLSRAMHMLADICCPPHVCGLTYFSRYAMAHKRYESRAAALFWDQPPASLSEETAAGKWAEKAVGKVPYSIYTALLKSCVPVSGEAWQSSTFAGICNRLALSGAEHLEAVLGDDEQLRARSIEQRIILSIAHSAALLAAFVRDLDDKTLPLWEENRPYWLKSFHTAFAVSKEPLYLHFADDGTVSLATEAGRKLAVGKFGRVLLTDQPDGLTTSFRFGREPLLTLYPNGDQDHLLAQIRGQMHCIKRVSALQGNLFLTQVSFALLTKEPENCRFMLD